MNRNEMSGTQRVKMTVGGLDGPRVELSRRDYNAWERDQISRGNIEDAKDNWHRRHDRGRG